MAQDMEEWLADSNEAFSLRSVRAAEDAGELAGEDLLKLETFHPAFTYPIFGEQEKIFGYKGLDIQLHFASGSLKQHLSINYDDKFHSTATPADDIEQKLYEFIPPDYTKSEEGFEHLVQQDAKSFAPLGNKVGSYTRLAAKGGKGKGKGKGKAKANGVAKGAESEVVDESSEDAVVYEMYHSTWATPGFREYHRRMQLFIILFIEGGSYVHEDEDAWEFITLYEKRRRPGSDSFTYHFVGYTSVYPFWCYPELVRLRLSQFVILPTYQRAGHGSQLYAALYQLVLSRPEVAELTVEDPAEAFEDLRDRNDLRYLVKEGIPADPSFWVDVGSDKRAGRAKWEQGIRKRYKLAQRQFDRLMEMLLLKDLDRENPLKLRAYRLHVKARLYRFNYETLAQATEAERKEALAKTYESVVEDYDRILEMTFG